MAKITLKDGSIIEGTIEEFKQMGVRFPIEEEPTFEPLKVGDFVKVCNEKESCFELGDILKITGFDGEHFYATRLFDGFEHYIDKQGEVSPATDEEVIIAEKWAKIGRKSIEFKVGDAVQYKKAFTLVSDIKPDGIVAINQSNHISKNIEVKAEDLTLVFPAEAKF